MPGFTGVRGVAPPNAPLPQSWARVWHAEFRVPQLDRWMLPSSKIDATSTSPGGVALPLGQLYTQVLLLQAGRRANPSARRNELGMPTPPWPGFLSGRAGHTERTFRAPRTGSTCCGM